MKRAALLLLLASAPALAAEAPSSFALKDGDRVVFYGDSITQDGAYARFVEEYVRTRFPQWDIRFYNAGVGGDTVRAAGRARSTSASSATSSRTSRPWSRSCSA